MLSLKIPPENKALLKTVKTYKKYQFILYNTARDKSVTNPSDKERMSRLFCDFFCKFRIANYKMMIIILNSALPNFFLFFSLFSLISSLEKVA